MNQITRAAASMAEGGLLLGIMTIFFMTFFIAVVIRLLLKGEQSYADIANLPVDDDERESGTSSSTVQRRP